MFIGIARICYLHCFTVVKVFYPVNSRPSPQLSLKTHRICTNPASRSSRGGGVWPLESPSSAAPGGQSR